MVPEIENSRTYNLRTRVILAWMRIMERKKLRPRVFHEESAATFSFEKTLILKEFLHIQVCRYRFHVFDDIFAQTACRRPKISA